MSRPALFNPMLNSLRRLATYLTGPRRVTLLLFVSLGLSLWLVSTDVTADRLFQSPQSPPPPAEVQPPAEQPPGEEPQPTTEPPASETPPAAEQPATNPTPAEEGAPPPLPTEPAPTEATPAPANRPVEPPAPSPDNIGTSARQFILDQAELIDAVVVSGAYLWLCCGILLFLLVPFVMLILYIRGRSKIKDEE